MRRPAGYTASEPVSSQYSPQRSPRLARIAIGRCAMSRPELSRVLRAALVLALSGLLAVVAGAQERPRPGGELVFLVPSEPPSYDGHREGTFGTVHPVAPHYNTLLRIGPTDRTGARPVGDLAESWTISPDGTTYTFRLRQGVRFHDGSPMT